LKSLLKLVLLFLACLYLEILFPGTAFPFPMKPTLLFVLFVSLKWREGIGALVGFFVGFLGAALYGEPPGLSAFAFTLVGYCAGIVSPFLKDTPRPVVFVFVWLMLLGTDLVMSGCFSILYRPGLALRPGCALSGALVLALVYPWLDRTFQKRRR